MGNTLSPQVKNYLTLPTTGFFSLPVLRGIPDRNVSTVILCNVINKMAEKNFQNSNYLCDDVTDG